jgi:selenium metabolism protein YedF
MTKQVVEEGETEIVVWVDNQGSAENVVRFAEKSGYKAQVKSVGNDCKVSLTKASTSQVEQSGAAEVACETGSWKLLKGKVLLISTDSLGRGSDELGGIIIKALLNTLAENDSLPEKIVLINSGVKLACEGSDVIEALQKIKDRGVEILACGTCLNYFNLTEKIEAGKVSNAYEILNSLLTGNVLAWS